MPLARELVPPALASRCTFKTVRKWIYMNHGCHSNEHTPLDDPRRRQGRIAES